MNPTAAARTPAALSQDRFILLPLRDLTGADDPACLTGAYADRRVLAITADLPNWPVVVHVSGFAPGCLFSDDSHTYYGSRARFGLVGKSRARGKFAKAGLLWWARKAGSFTCEATHHVTYSEALHAAAGLAN